MSRLNLRLKRIARASLPLILLVTSLGIAGYLHHSEGIEAQVLGFARPETEDVSAAEPTRVKAVLVDVGASVLPGDVVAMLDTSLIDADIAVARSERDEAAAAVGSERARTLRRIDDALSSLERELSRAKEEQAAAGAEAAAVRLESERVTKLVATKQAVVDDLSRLGIREAALRPLVAVKPRTVALIVAQAESLKRSRSELGPVTADLEARVTLTEQRLHRLELRRDGYTLRAVRGGRVIEVLKRAGEATEAGIPIVRLVAPASRVVACIPEGQAGTVTAGSIAKVRAKGSRSAPLRAVVTTLSPMVSELPVQCRPSLTVASWGRQVVLSLETEMDMVAGQSFDIEFVSGSANPPQPEAPKSVHIETEALAIRPITMPASVARETRFEPSGIAQQPGGRGYLVVSDDTGLGEDRVPLLFSMAPGGDLVSTMAIDGIDELTDLESIVAAPNGDVYVLSSQSRSKRGKRPKARTAFLRLEQKGDSYRVLDELHLAELLDAAGADAMKALGLGNSTVELEIEGMAMRDGAIYFGLKAPLDELGRAMIWRLSSPRALFDGKGLEAAGLTPFARVQLDLGGGVANGGISELLFLKSGALVVASTPSSGDEAAGAIFRVEKPDAASPLATTTIRRFPGRKPEGLAVSLAGAGGVVVVFDNGARPGELMELSP